MVDCILYTGETQEKITQSFKKDKKTVKFLNEKELHEI